MDFPISDEERQKAVDTARFRSLNQELVSILFYIRHGWNQENIFNKLKTITNIQTLGTYKDRVTELYNILKISGESATEKRNQLKVRYYEIIDAYLPDDANLPYNETLLPYWEPIPLPEGFEENLKNFEAKLLAGKTAEPPSDIGNPPPDIGKPVSDIGEEADEVTKQLGEIKNRQPANEPRMDNPPPPPIPVPVPVLFEGARIKQLIIADDPRHPRYQKPEPPPEPSLAQKVQELLKEKFKQLDLGSSADKVTSKVTAESEKVQELLKEKLKQVNWDKVAKGTAIVAAVGALAVVAAPVLLFGALAATALTFDPILIACVDAGEGEEPYYVSLYRWYD